MYPHHTLSAGEPLPFTLSATLSSSGSSLSPPASLLPPPPPPPPPPPLLLLLLLLLLLWLAPSRLASAPVRCSRLRRKFDASSPAEGPGAACCSGRLALCALAPAGGGVW